MYETRKMLVVVSRELVEPFKQEILAGKYVGEVIERRPQLGRTDEKALARLIRKRPADTVF